MKAYVNIQQDEIKVLINNLKNKKATILTSLDELKKANLSVSELDLVAINFDSFKNYLDKNIELNTLLENIDIENVNLLREAAKNYEKTIVITDEYDYSIDLDEITLEKRQELALKAFLATSKYDYLINQKLTQEFKAQQENKAYYFEKNRALSYGENHHQKAGLFNFNSKLDWAILNNCELTYNDFLDSSVALQIAAEFFDVAAIAVVKHANPTVVALSSDVEKAFDKALDSDPISPLNGIIAFSKEITLSLARKIRTMSAKVVLAPSFDFEALAELKKNKSLKLIQINTPLKDVLKFNDEEIKLTPFGALIQEKDSKDLDAKTFKVATKKKPQQAELEDMIFAYKVAKHAKSACAVVAKDLRTIGICASEDNEVNAVEIALNKVCDSAKDSVVAFDGALNSINNVQIMAQNRVIGAIETGDGLKHNEIVELADKMNISIISTAIRHFKH